MVPAHSGETCISTRAPGTRTVYPRARGGTRRT